MVYDSKLFNIDPFYDDYDEDKKFLRILYRPGFGLQARELTQMQTILQTQVQRFGDHIFEDGSKVVGCEISDQDVKWKHWCSWVFRIHTRYLVASDCLK